MKILLVSDDNNYAQSLKQKLVFLRCDDEIIISSYETALKEALLSSVVLIHQNVDIQKTLDLITELKNKSIIFISNSYEYVLQCVDCGADDFIMADAPDFEFVIRIVNNIKYNSAKFNALQDAKLLEQLKVKEGIYLYDYAKQVIENYIDENLIKNGVLLALSPSHTVKANFSPKDFISALKRSVRALDVLTFGKGLCFYVFLPESNVNDAICVYNKIKENSKLEICAGISEIFDKNFGQFEKEALNAMTEASTSKADFVIADGEKEETLDSWLDDGGKKGYKIFRQMFNKKLEKVIAPVFYRLQQTYDGKLFNTEIEQYVNDDSCVFKLSNKKNSSSLKIIYPGFSKIVISIIHEGLDSPENKEVQLKLSEITQSELISIVENYIKEFRLRCSV